MGLTEKPCQGNDERIVIKLHGTGTDEAGKYFRRWNFKILRNLNSEFNQNCLLLFLNPILLQLLNTHHPHSSRTIKCPIRVVVKTPQLCPPTPSLHWALSRPWLMSWLHSPWDDWSLIYITIAVPAQYGAGPLPFSQIPVFVGHVCVNVRASLRDSVTNLIEPSSSALI